MKKSRKIISLVICLSILMSTFLSANVFGLSVLAADTITIGGVTQQRVVGVSDPDNPTYPDTYAKYAMEFLSGASEPTDIVIPGLSATDDFIVQGLSYYAEKDWVMVSAYHKTEARNSMIFAINASTGKYEAGFAIYNQDGTPNHDHGGGLAFSANNFYYSGDDSDKDEKDTVADANCIAYAPLSQFKKPVDNDGDGLYDITLKGQVKLYEMGDAATAYVCYDEGILWAGNFYEDSIGASNYSSPVITSPKLVNTMIYGYKLNENLGSTDEEKSLNEWNYLTGTANNLYNHAGVPTHCIAVHTDIEDIQYAIVDKGRLYLSRSWGTGKNDETIASIVGSVGKTPDYSTLTVADIDLSVQGDITITHKTSTGTRTTKAHFIDEYENYDMMPMSEGLCFIDDNLYVSFEGASNKYMNEYAWSFPDNMTNTGNCDYPIDVVWKIDPYELLGEKRANTEESSYYEKVSDLSEIESGEEYIIVYESPEKDPVTQNNILYALDANGGFKDYRLSKRNDSNTNGYNGALGYRISDYSIIHSGKRTNEGTATKDRLYFFDWERDDKENIRWRLTKINDVPNNASADYYKIETPEFYFANSNRFFCDSDSICMASDNVVNVNKMQLWESNNGNGGFWISNGDSSFLWCNDGVSGNANGLYSDKINSYYSANANSVSMYENLTETNGTFHVDALNNSGNNIINGSINPNNSYEHGVFYIYKRVANKYASTSDSSVYTDMNAELQEDGTYTINLETYAIAPTQYTVANQRPTDFIFVLDTSTSMNEKDVYDYVENSGSLNIKTLAGGSDASSDPENANVIHVSDFSTYEYYYKTAEGYRPIRAAIKTTTRFMNYNPFNGNKIGLNIQQYYWAYYIGEDGLVYILKNSSSTPATGITKNEFTNILNNGTEEQLANSCSGKSSAQNNDSGIGDKRSETVLYTGTFYKLQYSNTSRLEYLKSATNLLTDKIVEDATTKNLDHRIAITQFGSWNTNAWHNTGLYSNGNTTFIPYSTSTEATTTTTITNEQFANAFFNINQTNTVKQIVNNLTTEGGDSGAFSTFGFSMANKIIENSNKNYLATGDRSVAVIMISSGLPGLDNNETNANNVAATAISEASRTKLVNGASIYTLKIGNGTLGNFKSNIYMSALSSKYLNATSLTNLGDKNPNGIEYSKTIPSVIDSRLKFIIDDIGYDVQNSSETGLAYLEADTIICEELTNAFIIPKTNSSITASYVPGTYDKIGRFSFGKPTNLPVEFKDTYTKETPATDTLFISHNAEENDRTFIVWGYNYTDQYISYSHPGNKLCITITGVIANKDAQIQNTSINEPTTAVYKDITWLDSNKAFKYFPTEHFNIPEYTYVLDYGLPMLDTNVNGTLCAVSNAPTKQNVTDYKAKLDYTQKSENGLVEIVNNSQDLVYRTTPTNFADSGYCLIKRDNGKYDWFEIKVVPASNVYFEEDYATDGRALDPCSPWNVVGSKPENSYQALTSENDVYGYDKIYDTETHTHSNGTAYKAEINSTIKRSSTKDFTFIGSGFELISACGENTGMIIVSVKNDTGKIVKAYIIDTYYDGEFANEDDKLIYQVPILRHICENGTYKVETSAIYLSNAGAINKSSKTTRQTGKLLTNTSDLKNTNDISELLNMPELSNADIEMIWFDDNSILNGGTGSTGYKNTRKTRSTTATTTSTPNSLDCYIDGFRIYHPLNENSTNYVSTEQSASYYNVINTLVDSETTNLNGIAYVTRNDNENTSSELTIEDYKQFGPKNELYLINSSDKALTFKVQLPSENSKVHIGLRAVNKATTVKIGTTEFTINSPMEMYYDITDCISVDDNGVGIVTIQNTGTGILSVNNVKFTASASIEIINEEDMNIAYSYITTVATEGFVVNGIVKTESEDINESENENITESEQDDNDSFNADISFIEKLIAEIFEMIMNMLKMFT